MILVTGSTGMIGHALVSFFLSNGIPVRAHARSQTSLTEAFDTSPESNLFQKAIADLSSLSEDEALKLCQGCTTVIHAAALVHKSNAELDLYERLNVSSTKLLYEAAAKCGTEQFIYLSSSSVYGNRATKMIEESAELVGDTAYAQSKISAEAFLKEKSMMLPSTVILRPSLVFGEKDRGNMLPLIRQVLSGKYFIVGDGSAAKSLIYTGDFARALHLLVKSPKTGLSIFNLANPDPVTVKQLSEAIQAAAGIKKGLVSLPSWFVSTSASLANSLLGSRSPLSADRLAKLTRENSVSVSKFQNAFNFKPEFELRNALAREIEWARKGRIL